MTCSIGLRFFFLQMPYTAIDVLTLTYGGHVHTHSKLETVATHSHAHVFHLAGLYVHKKLDSPCKFRVVVITVTL